MFLKLGDPASSELAPKLANLSRLLRAGLPVPPGIGLDPSDLDRPEAREALTHLLHEGPVIVRSALLDEDQPDSSAAGLGISVLDCSDVASVRRAVDGIVRATHDPWPVRSNPRLQLVIQHQVPRRWLAVVARDLAGTYVELHGPEPNDPLTAGSTPEFGGPLELCPPALRGPLADVVDQAARTFSSAPALDLEIIVDPAGRTWLVQARPLTRPLEPGWPAFLAEVAPGRDRIPDLAGLWHLDAEHNPAPLSPAHAGLVALVSPRSRVLGGWLYEPSRADAPDLADGGEDDHALLARLQGHTRAARRALADLSSQLVDADPPRLVACLDLALGLLRAALAAHAAISRRPEHLVFDPAAPLCLLDRAEHLDVLPLTWDIESPVLIDRIFAQGPVSPVSEAVPRDPAAVRVMLRELDDHLFALGLAPVRRVYLAAGERLGLSADVFLLTPPELRGVLRGQAPPDLEARRRERDRRQGLRPPLTLFDGRPTPSPPHRLLRGLPIGDPFQGPIAQRRDLGDLLARRPDPTSIVVIPALTAQAAVVLRTIGVQAVCCEHGGALSHAALMARELRLSALIGCRGCCDLPDGALATLDTCAGRLRLVS